MINLCVCFTLAKTESQEPVSRRQDRLTLNPLGRLYLTTKCEECMCLNEEFTSSTPCAIQGGLILDGRIEAD